MNRIIIIAAAFLLCSCAPQVLKTASDGQPIAFPGAEGFGKYTTGGRGGKAIIVSNLNDAGEGSLRKAIQAKGPRTVVFAVSGTIALESPLDINNPDITIAGQSAPGDGICLKNYSLNVKADNVIIRYLRVRMGDEKKYQGDALGGVKGNSNIIIDHCSVSWATDETASFYNNKNFSMQWCIISESLNASAHAKGEHGYGGIWGGRGASFHHNLLASHKSRTPRFSGSSTTKNTPDELVDFRNNVIYNWGENNIYGGEEGRYNVVANYFRSGKATDSSKKNRMLQPWSPYGKFYVAGNEISGYPAISDDNWSGGVQADHPDSAKADVAFQAVPITQHTARKAFDLVLAHAGASHKRDIVDSRITQEVRNGVSVSGKANNGIIDSPNDVGGWPELKSLTAPLDSDKDGVPDDWERKNKLNPNDPSDAAKVAAKTFYTNLEVYLNSLIKSI
ncbi:polysaccharide lyase family 1 protein [Paradesertivirga mongoliensis]|uniref:Polysaccharide lyase family 1 protein n=1 Tax=Paradesertivirga mongoliensis TaxID=2100740 RepID=A0ABW4ZIK1_9SPHI|nr:pectate lyase [Pedobacter mongoliensis]